MNLTTAEVRELPLAAALFQGDDTLAATPEWRAAGPGTVRFSARNAVLAVDTTDSGPLCAELVTRLLSAIAHAAGSAPHCVALRLRMLAAALAVVSGRAASTAPGTTADVLELACAGIAARTALRTTVRGGGHAPVADAAAAALVLVQLAVNAERHEAATAVELEVDAGPVFSVLWDGQVRGSAAATSRRRAGRTRWGLGYARVAADALGGAVYPPVTTGRRRAAVLELGVDRLALPLALVEDAVVRKATTAWDEETSLLPGRSVPEQSHAAACVDAAQRAGGSIASVDGWTARSTRRGVWLAIPPDCVRDRARDVLDGLVHERVLWDGVPAQESLGIAALAAVLGHALGSELTRVPGPVWNRRAPEVAGALGLRIAIPRCEGVAALDPRLALVLASWFGDALEARGEGLVLRLRPQSREDAVVRALAGGPADRLDLS